MIQTFQKTSKEGDLLTELKTCSNTRNLERGKQIHEELRGDSRIHVVTALVHMYGKCGSMFHARKVFDNIKCPDVVSWTALILGYAENGEAITALDLFAKMKSEGSEPNRVTFIAAIKACTALALEKFQAIRLLERGKQLHMLVSSHIDPDIVVQSALVDMYTKCSSMIDAEHAFDSIKRPNVIAWTSLVLGYAENGGGATALNLFAKMRYHGCAPDGYTLVAALRACTAMIDQWEKTECLELGRTIHSQSECYMDTRLKGALVEMYAKCGSMVEAKAVFDTIKQPDMALCTTLMLVYVENGEGLASLHLFEAMKSQGHVPDALACAAALKACALLGALEYGRKIHAEISSRTVTLVTSLVDFYAKCGSISEAQKVFDLYPRTRDVMTWTALLAGYSRLGHNEAVFGLFEEMQASEFLPNGVTFLCILSYCNHVGLVEKAIELFETMSSKYKIIPGSEHYTCMLSILVRLNRLDDSMALLLSMTCRPTAITWIAILDACRRFKYVALGRVAFMSVVSLDASKTAAYMLMSQIYESLGMWEEQNIVLGRRKSLKDIYEPGQTCWMNKAIEANIFLI